MVVTPERSSFKPIDIYSS